MNFVYLYTPCPTYMVNGINKVLGICLEIVSAFWVSYLVYFQCISYAFLVYFLFMSYIFLAQLTSRINWVLDICQEVLSALPMLSNGWATPPTENLATRYFLYKLYFLHRMQRSNSFRKLYFPGLFGFPYRSRVKS